jgi:hypothetical protein
MDFLGGWVPERAVMGDTCVVEADAGTHDQISEPGSDHMRWKSGRWAETERGSR